MDMKAFRYHYLSVLLLLSVGLDAQQSGETESLRKLDRRLISGDKAALWDIAPYLDSTQTVIEYLGYHQLEATPRSIAKRILDENCSFLDKELQIYDTTLTARKFLGFLNKHKDKIHYSATGGLYLLAPLEARSVKYQIRQLSDARKKELSEKAYAMMDYDWVKNNEIQIMIGHKDPEALLRIASELYKERDRFNGYNFDREEYTDMLQLLTGTEIATEDHKQELNWHQGKDFYPESQLNLLIFFVNHYKEYKWDQAKGIFVNPAFHPEPTATEAALFQLLNNKNDSIALDAFTQLTIGRPSYINALCAEYEDANIDRNYTLPQFPYKFLRQMAKLTEYCTRNDIDFKGSAIVPASISRLMSRMSFADLRKIENRIIGVLSLSDVTAFEYWSLIHEMDYSLTYSAGRILDIFYSRHWQQVIGDKTQLDLYLKKSALYERLGIIGICNKYLVKFHDADAATIRLLENYESSDTDILAASRKAYTESQVRTVKPNIKKKEWEGNKDYTVTHISEQLQKLSENIRDSDEASREAVQILAEIDYSQIGEALEATAKFPFKYDWYRYSFMERDWGLFHMDGFKEEARKDFLEHYRTLTEYQLYAYYLAKWGIDYQQADSSIDYDKVYDLIKYDVVEAFVGGGGGNQDNETYALIKLLELTFKTTLGYPHKICNSATSWGCDCVDRAAEWMQYMKDHQLLKRVHAEPVSFRGR